MLNGVTQLFMMKADVLSQVDSVKICESYNHNGIDSKEFPYEYNDSYSPNVIEVDNWELNGIPTYDKLPENLHAFISRVEASVDVPITLISLGPDRKETVLKKS